MEVSMQLSRIMISEMGEQQIIFLKETNGERSFPIVIGITEALAINRRLKGEPIPRPMTHDLLANVIDALGGELEKIVINDLRDRTFIATLYIRQGQELIEVDSRPSDAIALGIAMETPIFVEDEVLDKVLAEPSQEDRIELLRTRLMVLSERISDLSAQLESDETLEQMSQEDINENRRQLRAMQAEYDAIEQVLKNLE